MGAKFDKLKNKLSGEPGVTDPGGLAAAIGRKKYGKENFDNAAAKDKSPKMKKGDDDVVGSVPVSIDNDEEVEKAGLYKKQGVPKGVDPAKHERCVMDVKADGKDKSSAFAICNASMNKSEVDLEIEEMAKTMEYSTMDPIQEIKKAISELGPEGLKKALPNMTDENKELLNNVLEEMNKSHKLPLSPPRKLTNVGGDNYVQEDVSGDEADEAIFDASVKEGDNEQKHQGGSHDQPYKLDWEGQMIKSLDEFTMEELATFGEIYKAMKMKKNMKKDMAEEEAESADEVMPEGDAPVEKAVSASPKLWGKPPAKRGVGIYKGKEDDSVAEDVKEVEGPKKLNEVMDEAPEGKKDDILRELRDKKMKKAKDMMKAAMKKECEGMDEVEGEMKLDKMKKNMRKALVEVLSEEWSDEDIVKAKEMMDKGGKGSGPRKGDSRSSDPGLGGKTGSVRGGKDNASTEAGKQKIIDKFNRKAPVKEFGADSPEVAEMNAKMKKAQELFIAATETDNPVIADLLLNKAKEMLDSEPKLAEFKQVDPEMKDGNAAALNEGKMKLKQEEPADAAKDTADEALAEVKGEMKKSIKWYGEPNDAFKAGRLGRHSYASSVNEYYDAALYKAENPVKKEEELKKSINVNDINDLIEHGLFKSAVELETSNKMNEFKKSQGGFTRTSFSEDDMIATCHISKEDIEKL